MKTRRRRRFAALVALLPAAATLDGTGQTRPDDPQAGEVVGEVGGRPPRTANRELILEREVYTYPARGRRDPFRPSDLPSYHTPGTETISLLGIIHHPDPAYRVAVIRIHRGFRGIARADVEPAAPVVSRLRSGEVRAGLRIVAIEVDSVVVEVDERGATTTRVLALPRTAGKEGS